MPHSPTTLLYIFSGWLAIVAVALAIAFYIGIRNERRYWRDLHDRRDSQSKITAGSADSAGIQDSVSRTPSNRETERYDRLLAETETGG